MDFGSISGRSSKSSMKRKQSNSLLTAFRKSSQPPTSYVPPASTTSSHFPEPESPYAESISSYSHSQSQHNDFGPPSASGSGSTRYAESTASSSRTATNSADAQYLPYGRGGAGRMRSGSRAVSLKGALSNSGSGQSQHGSEGHAPSGERREREKSGGGAIVRRPEDLVQVVRDRLFSWSYMMQWYQGETHWFNTVKIPRSTTEAHLGPKALESRARNYFILGISLGLVFDTANGADFLRSVSKVLEEWEGMVEGGGKVRGLFKGQKGSRKSGTSATGGEYMGMQDGDSALMQVNLPFTLDFFQVHCTTCSLIRDIYRKILKFYLPSRSGFVPPPPDPNALTHPSTIIHSAPSDPSAPPFSRSNSGSAAEFSQATMRSPSSRSTSSASRTPGSFGAGFSSPRPTESDEMGLSMEQAFMNAAGGTPGGPRGAGGTEGEYDALQAFILGELGADRMLVGEGQAMTKEVVELFTKVDAKLRKHFASLLRETDTLARRVLDDELNALMMSLNPGTTPLTFDYNAALSNAGNGFALSQSRSRSRPGSTGTSGTGGGGGYYGGGEPVPPLPTGGGSSIYGRE